MKKTTYILGLTSILALSYVFSLLPIGMGQAQVIAPELQLKTDSSKIIGTQNYTHKGKTASVKYAYYTDPVVGAFGGENLSKRTPTSWTKEAGLDRDGVQLGEFIDGKGERMIKAETTFFTAKTYVQGTDRSWRAIEFATTTKSAFDQQVTIGSWIRLALADDFFPDPSPESTSVDGVVNLEGNSWANAVADDPATSADDSSVNGSIGCERSAGGNFFITKLIVLFDTSAMGAGATVDSASLSLHWFQNNVDDDDAQAYYRIVASTPNSNTAVITADADQLGTTGLAPDVNINTITNGQYEVFTLNATGEAAIDPAGVSKFGAREGHDIENSEIGSGSGDVDNRNAIRMSETADTTSDPKLTVTFTAGVAGGGGQQFWMGTAF